MHCMSIGKINPRKHHAPPLSGEFYKLYWLTFGLWSPNIVCLDFPVEVASFYIEDLCGF